MPFVNCPGCGREIPVYDGEWGTPFECAVCDTPFVPEPPPDPEPVPEPPRRRPLAVAVAVVLGALFVVGLLLRFAGEASDQSHGAAHNDPYSPDCAIVRDYLKVQYGEVEVISWGQRTISRSAVLGDHASLTVRFRVSGSNGTKFGLFIIGPGDVVESATITD